MRGCWRRPLGSKRFSQNRRNRERTVNMGMNGKDELRIERVPAPTDDVRALIGELDRTLAAEYSPEQQHGLPLDAIFQPHVRFFLARRNGAAVGCGGIAFFEDFAEVKRMYVRESQRGTGVAKALLSRLEFEAKQNGTELLRLETGDAQHAAMRLYEHAGFHLCEPFGDYSSMTPQAIATSVFYEKRLAPG